MLDPRTVADLADRVADIVREAAATAILPCLGQLKDSDTFEKSPGEVVTTADHESERILSERLATLLPGARIIGEEACAADPLIMDRINDRLVWIVDPLDGTPNFVAGRAPFGIIVALAEEGIVRAGWLYDPLTERLCFASYGGGAWIRHGDARAERLKVGLPAVRPVASLATQFMPPPLADRLAELASEHFDLRPIPRCAAEHYPRLCLGENHVALFQRTLPWDHGAGVLLLTEAGGHVARWSGKPYRFHDHDVGILAATSVELWQRAADALFGDEMVHDYIRSLLPRTPEPGS